MPESAPYRLPRNAVPKRYALTLDLDLEGGRFRGEVVIDLDLCEESRELVLNAVDLTIEDAILEAAPLKRRAVVHDHPEVEQVVLAFTEPLAAGAQRLTLAFRGRMADDLRGLYRARIQAADGSALTFAVSQFEPTDARRLLPCWDEPDLKAVFSVCLVVPDGVTALSNGSERASDPVPGGRRRITFAETMPISTYLLAIVVGPLALTAPVLAGTVPVRIGARAELMPMAQIARDEAVQALAFFQDYFGIPYPAAKLDHVAVPEFSAGAMENLGLVTYREEALLLDPDRASPRERMSVWETIAHETAHMWFGDLVTMRWWNGIWLNEAFATLMEHLATERVHPEWQIWATIAPGRAHALAVDGLATTRPIEFPVGPPAQAEAMFDTLTYDKGGAVLRMLEQHLGAETFRRGVGLYLERHRHGNAETRDLWAALEAASETPVAAIMAAWVERGGYPLVRAERLLTSPAHLRLSQTPFQYLGEGQGTWQVPVGIGVGLQDGGRTVLRVLLGDAPLTVALPTGARWAVVNHAGDGFFRSAYSPDLWREVIAAWPELDAVERASLLDDVWAAVLAGRGPLEPAVALWRSLGGETDPNVWATVAAQLALVERIADEGGREALGRFVRHLVRPLFDPLGWEERSGESFGRGRLRAVLLGLLGTVGRDPAVRDEARARLSSHLSGRPALPPSALTQAALVAAHAGGAAEWNLLREAYGQARTPQDEVRYLTALGAFREPELGRRSLDLFFTGAVRIQDAPYAIVGALRNEITQAAAWARVERDWDDLLRRFHPTVVEAFARALPVMLEPTLAERASAWLRAHPVPEAAPQVAQGLEMQSVHRLLERRLKDRVAAILDAPST